MAPIRVVVADDSAIIREGLVTILAAEPGIELVGVCADGAALDALVVDERPDVVITDLRMPPSGVREGLLVAARLRQREPHVGVVVLSQYAEPEIALDLMGDGSAGRAYLLKDRVAEASELVRAVRAVHDGGSAVDPSVVEMLIEFRTREARSALAELTPREREVLAAIAEGRSNTAIAESLVLTRRAVEKHVNSIFGKLGLTQSESVSRRVKAALLFLAEDGPARDRRPGG